MPEVPAAPRRGLVLGAGGVLGAAWTIGALQAYEQATGRDPRDADVVVGTSAGAVLAAFLGCGLGTATMANHQRGVVAEGDPAFDYDYETTAGMPPRPRLRLGSRRLLATTARRPRSVGLTAALAAVLPQGRGTLEPIGRLVEAAELAAAAGMGGMGGVGGVAGTVERPGDGLSAGGWPAHPQTWVVAMDYDTGRRVPFGRPGSPRARLSEAVMASCAIPGWYAPVEIGARRYVDGGARSATSLDLLAPLGLAEVVVLAPMASFDYDQPASTLARLERQIRRAVTRKLLREAAKVRAAGTRVRIVVPGPHDLEAMGGNMMDARRREQVFEASVRTSADAFAADRPASFAAAG
jgi:NTE family protein